MTVTEPSTDDDDDRSAAFRDAARIDTNVAHPARMYDYYLGGYSRYS